MLWFIPRVLVLSLALIAICAAGVAIGRLDHSPDALQALGFDVCDGEPCFRGVKPGMDWAQAQQLVSGTFITENTLYVPLNEASDIMVGRSQDGKTVERIISPSGSGSPTIDLGTVLLRYGRPCRMILEQTDAADQIDVPYRVYLFYPTLTVLVIFEHAYPVVRSNYRLKSNTPIQFWVAKPDPDKWCDMPDSSFIGAWYGFTSFENYEDQFQRQSNLSSGSEDQEH
jgi:hypothetical protein